MRHRPQEFLSLFHLSNPTGHHQAAWAAFLGSDADASVNLKHYVEVVKIRGSGETRCDLSADDNQGMRGGPPEVVRTGWRNISLASSR